MVEISLFCASVNFLAYLPLNMSPNKSASSACVDSACKRKHVSLSLQRTKAGTDAEAGHWR